MNKISVLGIDLVKHVFQLHGDDAQDYAVLRKTVKHKQLLPFLAWEIAALGHTVQAMASQFVKPYIMSNRNDANYAEAIRETV